jgi:hypothetical protein
MSAMSQQLQIGEDIVPIPVTQPLTRKDLHTGSNPFKTLLRILGTLLVSPLLLVVAVGGFLIVLADFTWFRLREIRYGHPQPKGLWEF